MITKATDVCLLHWTTKLEKQASTTETSKPQLEELQHTLRVLESISNQMYFASGAFGP